MPRFYNELVGAWSDASENDSKKVLEISGEVLWNNFNISSKGESLFNQYLIDKGVVTVGDTISDKGEILTWEEVKRKYSSSSHYVLDWLGLVNCIPKKCKDKLHSSHKENTSDNLHSTKKTATELFIKVCISEARKPLIKPPTTQTFWISF